MFGNVITALITPFTEKDHLDLVAFEELVRWQIEAGTDALVLSGSTGEGSSLSKEEKCTLFEIGVRLGKGKIGLLANTGTNLTEESVWMTRKAKEIGMEGCLAIVPYYNKPTAEGCFRHFSALADVGLPMILYHHPGRTGLKLSFEALSRICMLNEVVAIKDATGDLNLAMELIQKGKIHLYSGDDGLALAQLSIGLMGSISIIGNVAPIEWREFVMTALAGDQKLAREKFYALYDLVNSLVLETNPQCVKYAVSRLGKVLPNLRLPLIEPSDENKALIRGALQMSTLDTGALRA